jgi:ubiquinone/menaquinone biosynthesis C-methylase UbiE
MWVMTPDPLRSTALAWCVGCHSWGYSGVLVGSHRLEMIHRRRLLFRLCELPGRFTACYPTATETVPGGQPSPEIVVTPGTRCWARRLVSREDRPLRVMLCASRSSDTKHHRRSSKVITNCNRPLKGRVLNTISTSAIFGQYAGYEAAITALFIIGVLVVGFRQGRDISFWPPKVGARPQARENNKAYPSHIARRASNERLRVRDMAPRNASATFEASDAREFYQMIASKYDERNSANLIATHMDTIERIEQARTGNPRLRVLDLGGGTGQNIATHFFNDERICWDYVDSSSEMMSQFNQNLAGRPLSKNLKVYLADISQLNQLGLPRTEYDVILLSLVLSSMPQSLDFSSISKLLSSGGSLIISDINPAYTRAHPYYEVRTSDDGTVALRTNPVEVLDIIKEALSAGLCLTELTPIGEKKPSYSFIATFGLAVYSEIQNPGMTP